MSNFSKVTGAFMRFRSDLLAAGHEPPAKVMFDPKTFNEIMIEMYRDGEPSSFYPSDIFAANICGIKIAPRFPKDEEE